MCWDKSITQPNDLIGYIPWKEFHLDNEPYSMTQEQNDLMGYIPWKEFYQDNEPYSMTQEQFEALAALLVELEDDNFFEVPASAECGNEISGRSPEAVRAREFPHNN